MEDYRLHLREPILSKDRARDYRHPLHKLTGLQWWISVVVNILLLVVGQSAGVLLGRYYYDEGGNSKWMASLVQTAAFPILFIPYIFLRPFDEPPNSGSSSSSSSVPSVLILGTIYFIIGALIAGDNMMYSFALSNLSASTYSLICATQLAFTAIFSLFINRQKFTALILNSVVVLSFAAALLSVNDDDDSSGNVLSVSERKYTVGVVLALGASALYALLLSLMQLTFEKVVKKETFTVVLEMQIYTAIVATVVTTAGLFVSGEWKSIAGEMEGFGAGKVSYVMTLVWIAVAWQLCSVAVVGLIYVVSSLFSNVISTLSLAITPIASLVVFHDRMNGVKIVAMLLAFWGFASYVYQNYLDDREARKNDRDGS
ncbi:probable purine permease 11 [Andrographis paniculata]|uniref:probable purine permease 11 n=1 Tax=Andrographis paniculata TaxID=175694 RepID=UPI0021E79AA5|nr:probable purine permease 11 [Andrographis paniculata]XP_051132181.1 probable purine permease 11 [Andrographis paniculata]